MKEDSVFFIGVDASEATHAIAIAGAGAMERCAISARSRLRRQTVPAGEGDVNSTKPSIARRLRTRLP